MRNCALGLSPARGRWPRAVLETSNTVSPNTDRPRPVNNIITLYGIAFVALREALWYSVSTSTCIQHVTQVHFRDRRGRASLRPARKPRRHNRFFCVNRSPIRYDFLGGAQAIRYTVNIALTFTQFLDNSKFQALLSIDEIKMNESEMIPSDSNTCMFVF